MADEVVKFPELTVAPISSLSEVSFFVGYIDNGDGSFNDYRFTRDQIVNAVTELTQKKFLAPSTGSTITLDWFDGKTIGTLYFNNQCFFSGENFTQIGDTITLLNNLGVIIGQKIKADTI